MKLYFKYSTDLWALAPMATGKNDNFNMAIDKPTTSTITINRPGFMVLNDGLAGEGGWTKTNTDWHFTKFVLVDDDVLSTDLDADVDAEKIYWMGKAIQVIPQELTTQIICESYNAQLWRELIDEDDNIVTIDSDDSFLIKSFINTNSQIELTDASGNAVSFDNDENNGRGCRITARDQEAVKCIVAANSDMGIQSGYSSDVYTEDYTKLADDSSTTQGSYVENNDKATQAGAETMIELYITVPRFPKKINSIDITVAIYGQYFNDTGSGMTNVSKPYLEIYNRDTSSYVRLRTWDYTELPGPEVFKFSVDTGNFDAYWNSSTHKVLLRVFSGCTTTGAGHFYGRIAIAELYFGVACYNESIPREYIIADTANSDELTVTIDSGVYDTLVNRHSLGDTVEILYQNEEWLEDIISTYALDINEISAPTSAAPTYSKLRFKPIGQNIKDINDLEEWYCYLTRSTTSGKPDLVFVDRSSPTASGYAITPECIVTNKGNILPKLNALDIVREAVVSNGESTGTSGVVAISNYRRVAATRADMSTAYLEALADAILAQHDAVQDDYELTIDKLWDITEEEFVLIKDVPVDNLVPGVTVDITAGNARGSATTPIDVEDVIIRELKWLPSLDACTLKLGFADGGVKSMQERMFELIARQRYETGLQ